MDTYFQFIYIYIYCTVFEPILKTTNKLQGQARGYAFITFSTPVEAEKAINESEGLEIQGKEVHVAPAHRKEDRRGLYQLVCFLV